MLVYFTDPIRLNSLPHSLSRFSTLMHVSRLTQAGAPAHLGVWYLARGHLGSAPATSTLLQFWCAAGI